MTGADEPATYVAEHLRDDLVRHPDVGELDLHVAVDGNRIVVTGHVSTQDRHDAITRVLADLAPRQDVRNETTIAVYPEVPEGTSA